MDNPLANQREYSIFVHTLPSLYPAIQSSSLIFIPRGARMAIVNGDIFFDKGYRLEVKERLIYRRDTINIIQWYGYEIWRADEKLAWYDPQPHPNDPTLASTHPHHKHIPPNIKRNRIPAPNMSFSRPNLPVLIAEIEMLLLST